MGQTLFDLLNGRALRVYTADDLRQVETLRGWRIAKEKAVLLQKSKSPIFDGCNPLKYRDTIFDKSVKNQFLQQTPPRHAIVPCQG